MSTSVVEVETRLAPDRTDKAPPVWPRRVGRFELTVHRQLSERECIGEGPTAVVHLIHLGRLHASTISAAVMWRLRRRLRDSTRALGSVGHPHILRALACDQEGEFAWFAAEHPGEGHEPWRPDYPALDSLALALAYLHERKFCHGRLAAESVWRRADGTTALAPWLGPSVLMPELVEASAESRSFMRLTGFVFAPELDVLDALKFFPSGDAGYDDVADRCQLLRKPWPTGRKLLSLLRATPQGGRYAAERGIERWGRAHDLNLQAEAWLECPEFISPSPDNSAWDRLLKTYRLEPNVIRLYGREGSGKTRWLTALAEDAWKADGTVVAVGFADPARGALVAALQDLALPVEPEEVARAQKASTADDLAQAIRCYRQRIESRRFLLLLDDVDRYDSKTLAAVRQLQGYAAVDRFVIVTTETGDPVERVPSRSGAPPEESFVIPPFGEVEIQRLLESFLGTASGTGELARILVEVSEGSPLYVVELLRDFLREEIVLGQENRWSIQWSRLGLRVPNDKDAPLRPTEWTYHLPRGVSGLLERKLTAVGEMQTQVLRVMAVAAAEVDVELLHTVLGEDDEAIFAAMEDLEAAGIVELDRNEVVRFRTGIARRFFVERCDADLARKLHGALLRSYEKLWPGGAVPGPMEIWPASAGLLREEIEEERRRGLEQRVRVLAQHALGAGDVDGQRRYLPFAGASEARAGKYQEARDLYTQAIEVLCDPAMLLWARLGLSEMQYFLTDLTRAEAGFRKALEEGRACGDLRAEARAFFGLGAGHYLQGQLKEASACAERAAQVAAAAGDAYIESRAQELLAKSWSRQGNADAALAANGRVTALATMVARSLQDLRSDHVHGLSLLRSGAYREAAALFTVLGPRALAAGDRRLHAFCVILEARVLLMSGRYPEAVNRFDQAALLARAIGDRTILTQALISAALASGLMLRGGAAEERVQLAREIFEEDRADRYGLAYLERTSAWLELFGEHDKKALWHAEQCARFAQQTDDPGIRAMSHEARGVTALFTGDLKVARDEIEAALAAVLRNGDVYLQHFYGIYRAVCEVSALRQGIGSDRGRARALLEAAFDFGSKTESHDITLAAACCLCGMGIAMERAAKTAARALAQSSTVTCAELKFRRDLAFLKALAPALDLDGGE